ncbi:MAG: hypothetical protein U0183_21115 [Polyangiaceae bacterium]
MNRPPTKPNDDSSVSSLGELMRLEKERVASEEKRHLAAHEAKLAAEARAAEALLREEEARRRDAERAREIRAEEDRRLEARIEAEKRAAIERERVLAEGQVAERARVLEREHELAVKRLEVLASAERSPAAGLFGYALAGLVALGSAAGYFGIVRPAAEARLAEADALLRQNGVALERARADLAAEKAKAEATSRDVSRGEARIAALEAELRAARAHAPSTHAPTGPHAGTSKGPSAAEPPCVPGDPLCPTIGRP